jgi:hypothetical protein
MLTYRCKILPTINEKVLKPVSVLQVVVYVCFKFKIRFEFFGGGDVPKWVLTWLGLLSYVPYFWESGPHLGNLPRLGRYLKNLLCESLFKK